MLALTRALHAPLRGKIDASEGKALAQLKKAIQPLFVPECVWPRSLPSLPTLAPCPRSLPIRSLPSNIHALSLSPRRGSRRYGGSYETWRQRPLSAALIEYAAADVAHLHTLRGAWGHLISDERMEAIVASTPLRRMVEHDELARLTAFLASDLARCFTGQFILADAGAFLSRTRPANDEGLTSELRGSNAK